MQELGEEGAIQVFETVVGNTLLLGAVGQLQFEVVAARLASEYKVDAIYDDAGIATARWLTYPDDKVRRDFERDRAASLATDVDGNPVYLAPNRFNLQVAMERWPQVGFHATREHGEQHDARRRPRFTSKTGPPRGPVSTRSFTTPAAPAYSAADTSTAERSGRRHGGSGRDRSRRRAVAAPTVAAARRRGAVRRRDPPDRLGGG